VRLRNLPTDFQSQAPVRLDFAGAWTDVPPFSQREGGIVVNAAIELYARAALKIEGSLLRLVSEDLGQTVECVNSAGLVLDGKLDLLKAALRMYPVTGGFTLTTRSDAPKGSDVALVKVLIEARQERLSERELAEQAWHLEVVEAGYPGGKQDQYAGALGGFHRFTFRDPDVGVEPLTLDPAFATALERQIVLCYMGQSRVSGDTIRRVVEAYERGDRVVTGALRALKDLGEAMTEALREANLGKVGALLAENWKRQLQLDPAMRTSEMGKLEQTMAGVQVIGGKAAGAGAGGCMFFLAKGSAAGPMDAARNAGATVLPVSWASEGARAW
jgi:D-glycero-alpha-D-manno-heptose-7-phosphate kinase